eukprot:TRINITY_DN18300_c0_g2_i1.p1 TRINITY_DN18300_c0_g2~~TRINITY_DN18300_c0_g2_i1.p1  ORF type:complete len:325 (-),score=66.92 TRINITY_DN18300_c0_g2_i1:35-1009(-)
MHRPTHDAQCERSKRYPFSGYLAGKKRLWELRFQVRFKQRPAGQIFFGVELDKFVPVSGLARQAQKALVSACKGVVGECYHSVGDDPDRTWGELEVPMFVMPLWAFDYFHVASAGEEPPRLDGDLSSVGMRRTDGVSNYIKAMQAAIADISTDKVYTFSFWGISQFLDVLRWEVSGGLIPGMTIDFDKLCGAPPVFLTMYALPENESQDKRHLRSRQRRFFRAEIWSALRPPSADRKRPDEEAARPELQVDYWSGMAGFENYASGDAALPGAAGNAAPAPAAPAAMGFEDLLGLDAPAAEPIKAPGNSGAIAAADQSCDLLGLG